ncbi:hypothetical protein DFH08DRAFT_947711 [Mycena albidolilacea]|uniref:Uncharacterized protein n=1 Tax=Mycena albidolilacea TaxID=1033008 RepID=A0AAD7AVK1_9AGAR|nr:hypothetical protein DFH08DRAFT_947711 [Mycena albidolilacea]
MIFSFRKTVLTATACSLLVAAAPSPRACGASEFSSGFFGTISSGTQGTHVDGISFNGLTAGQTFTLTVVGAPLTTSRLSSRCQPFTGNAVTALTAGVVDASFKFNPYNPGSTPLDQVVTTTSVSANKLTAVASVRDGAESLEVNVVVEFVGEMAAELNSVLSSVGVILA